MTGKVSAPRFFTIPALVILLLSLVPFPVQAAGEGNAQRPAIRPSVRLQETIPVSDQSAPAADTDRWRLDDVYVKETVCQILYGPSREEYGAFGLQSVSPVCNGASLGKGIRTLHTEGTMRIGYPELLQGGQPAVFTAEADGSMTWELLDTTKTGTAWLELSQSSDGVAPSLQVR